MKRYPGSFLSLLELAVFLFVLAVLFVVSHGVPA